MTKIRVTAGEVVLSGELTDGPTARKIAGALPIEGRARRWGQEIYFDVPVTASLEEEAREEMVPGELAYWPPGKAFCIFFGPTPASRGSEPRAASDVNPVGRLDGDVAALDAVTDGEKVVIQAE